jgi:P-type Cu+ transporter
VTAPSTLEFRVQGMDCPQCAIHVCHAIEALDGVSYADVRLTAGKAVVELDADRVSVDHIRAAVAAVGYTVPAGEGEPDDAHLERSATAFAKRAALFMGMVFGAVLLVVVAGEWLGLFERATDSVPFGVGIVIVLTIGWPPFVKVIRATLQRRVVSHTLMTVGVVAALVIGQWVTAAVVAFFMRVGDLVEGFTVQRGGQAVRDLASLAPRTARVVRGSEDVEVPVEEVQPGDEVRVRPGEKIPADGTVLSGTAFVEQAAITGESMPTSVGPGSTVYAAALISEGALRVRVERVGADATFGRILRLIEEAESNRSRVQLLADKFSAQYLPIVAVVALLTFIIRRDPLATTAVLVVACSCAFALATPVAMLASIGTAARRGLLVKGGKYLELLARADVLLLDKTGTLTLGRPRVVEVTALHGPSENEVLRLAGSVERFSEHPLAAAVVSACRERGLEVEEPAHFEAKPGRGVTATLKSGTVCVGSAAFAGSEGAGPGVTPSEVDGATKIYVSLNGTVVGILHVTDTLRPEVPAALRELHGLGIVDVEMLTGDSEAAASAVAGQLGVRYRAELLPEDKIEIVREHQRQGRTVVMVGDGVNDAPALAQADVGIAMGAAGTDLALEVSDVALLRDDWSLLPEVFRIARRSMGVVRMNLAFTGLYNLVGLTLAAVGILPPILAAAAQSIPDLGILGNSARLLRAK